MPVNASDPRYFKAQDRYASARSPEEKMHALEDMLKYAPTHKGAEKLRSDLKGKLAKVKKELSKSKKSGPTHKSTVRKEGDVQICMLGLSNSGKSTILNSLTGSNAKVGNYMYTTKEPEVGVFSYGGALIQVVEIPATLEPQFTSIVYTTDAVLVVLDANRDLDEQREKLSKFTYDKPKIEIVNDFTEIDLETLKKKIWECFDVVRVYTRGHEKDKAIVIEKGETVREFTKNIHKDFLKHFRFARVWGPSAKFDGEQVGLEHVLKDGDIVEIFA